MVQIVMDLDEFDQMITDGESVVFETQKVAKLIEPEKNISIFKMNLKIPLRR